MKRKPLRRVYIMDCGKFIKIGISTDAERRRTQIPYDVLRYYCTEPLKNASDIERYMHDLYRPVRCERAKGTEYFNVACKILETSLSVNQSKRNQAVMAILKLSGDKSYEFNTRFYNALNETMKMPDCLLELISCFAFDMIVPNQKKKSVSREDENGAYIAGDYIKIPKEFINTGCFRQPESLAVFLYLILKANENESELPKGIVAESVKDISKAVILPDDNANEVLEWLEMSGYIKNIGGSVYEINHCDLFLL